MLIRELVVKLTADKAEFVNGIEEAAQVAESRTSKLKDTVNSIGTGLLLGGGAVIGGGIAAVGGIALNTASQVDTAMDTVNAALGGAVAESRDFEGIMKGIYSNNFGDSFDDIASSLVTVEQNFRKIGDVGDSELQKITQSAFALRDTFGEDVNATTSAAATLMEQFGITSDEAMDLIARGFQKGFNKSGDFLDTINEYSTQFSAGGADANQFFNLLESGLAGGVLGTDKAADAFKEFRVRIQDGSKLTAESLEMIGINSEDMLAKLASGELTAVDAFNQVQNAMGKVDDENLLMQAGVGLLGTQFEDLGTEGALALTTIGNAMGQAEGAVDDLNAKYENFPSMFEGFKRSVLVALEPIGGKLLEMGNNILPYLIEGFQSFATNLEGWVTSATQKVDEFFSNWDENKTFLENIATGIQTVLSGIIPPELLSNIGMVKDVIFNLFDRVVELGGTAIDLGLDFLKDESTISAAVTLKDVIVELFTRIQEAVSTGLDMGSTVLGWLQQHGVSLTELITGIGLAFGTFTVLTTVVDGLNKARTAFSLLQGGLAAIQGASGLGGLVALLGGPVTLAIGAIALAVGALYVAWVNDFGGIQEKVRSVWNFLKPTFETLRTWLVDTLTNALTTLSGYWTNTLYPAIQKVWQFTENHVIPLLKELGRVLNITLKLALEVVAGVWENILLPAIRKVNDFVNNSIMPKLRDLRDLLADKLAPALDVVAGFFDEVKSAVSGLAGLIDGATSSIREFGDWLSGLTLPEWLQRHSPPPLYTSLIEIKDAMKGVTKEARNLDKALEFRTPNIGTQYSLAGALANGRVTGVTPTEPVIMNIHPQGEIDVELIVRKVAKLISQKK